MYVISRGDCLFFYFCDLIRGLIGPFASLLDSSFAFSLPRVRTRPWRIDLVLFAAFFIDFYLASLVIFDRSFPAYFPHPFPSLSAFPFPLFFVPSPFAFVFRVRFPCSLPSRFPSPLFLLVSRLPVPSPFLSRLPPACSVPLSRLLSRLPFPSCSFCSRFPVRFPVLFPFLFWCRVRSSVRCVRSFVRSFVRSCACSFVRSFVRSFARLFGRSFAGIFSRFPCSSSRLVPPSPYFPSPSVLLGLLMYWSTL